MVAAVVVVLAVAVVVAVALEAEMVAAEVSACCCCFFCSSSQTFCFFPAAFCNCMYSIVIYAASMAITEAYFLYQGMHAGALADSCLCKQLPVTAAACKPYIVQTWHAYKVVSATSQPLRSQIHVHCGSCICVAAELSMQDLAGFACGLTPTSGLLQKGHRLHSEGSWCMALQ